LNCCFSLFLLHFTLMEDYYKTLNISRSASEEEVKKAYRKLAHKHHPDKPGGNEKKFKEINEAYQVLSNKEKRAQYDKFGRVFEGAGGGGGGYSAQGFGGAGFDPSNFGFNGDFADLGDIFEGFFGGFGGRTRTTYKHGSDIEMIQEITLEEAYRGTKRHIAFKTFIVCGACNGIGHKKDAEMIDCAACAGKGEVREEKRTFFGNFAQVKECVTCGGRGRVPKEACKTCGGEGKIRGEREVSVDISAGIEDKQIIKIQGAGESGERGGGNGDLYVVVRVRQHSVFKRVKNDLLVEKEVAITDILLEKKVQVRGIGGETFELVVPTNFDVREKLKVSGRGMPKLGSPREKGDMFISIHLKFPKKLSKKAKDLIEELEKELQ